MRTLLKPGGQLRIVGLSADESLIDWILAGALLVPIRLMSRIHHESGYPDMTTTRPSEWLTEIKAAAAEILPGSRVRRRFYYRYTLTWAKPPDS